MRAARAALPPRTTGLAMQAIVYPRYGGPEALQLQEVDLPQPAPGEVRLRVHAASLNPMDYHLMRGSWLMRPMTGLRRPKRNQPGVDVAGEVDAVGAGVTRFRAGDAV